MFNIFTGKGVGAGGIKVAFNIKQTDFEMLAKALRSMPAIQRKVIHDIATRQAILHMAQLKEKMFWIGVAEGCGVE